MGWDGREKRALFQEDLGGGQRNRGQLETLLSIELPGPVCGEHTSALSLLPLSIPKVSGRGPEPWPLLWSGSGPVSLALAHLRVDLRWRKQGGVTAFQAFLAKRLPLLQFQEALALRGWYTEGRIPIRAMEGTESREPTRAQNPTGSGKPRVLPGPGEPVCAWLDCRDLLCAAVVTGPEERQEKLQMWGDHSVDSWAV